MKYSEHMSYCETNSYELCAYMFFFFISLKGICVTKSTGDIYFHTTVFHYM